MSHADEPPGEVLCVPIRETVGANLLDTYRHDVELFCAAPLRGAEAERRVRRYPV